MHLSATMDYAADPARVFALLMDKEFQEAKCARSGSINSYVEITGDGGEQTVIVTKRTLSTAKFPDFIRNLLGESILVVQTDTWGPAAEDGSRGGTTRVAVEGAPVNVEGTLDLHPTGGGCAEIIEGELRAGVPLVGGKIEKAAAPAVNSALEAEKHTMEEWLAQGR